MRYRMVSERIPPRPIGRGVIRLGEARAFPEFEDYKLEEAELNICF
jgi:hypothetical protein